uniref:RING-type domain-containing protein n=1 Tax=Oryza punctata TaxID=4537 RepID=A0A0E0L7Q5_ORYPU
MSSSSSTSSSLAMDRGEDDYELLRQDHHNDMTTSSESVNQQRAGAAELNQSEDDGTEAMDVDDYIGGGEALIGLKTVEAQDDGSNCPICLDGGGVDAAEEKTTTEAWVETPCSHRFHSRCLETWAQVKLGTCPMCRRALTAAAAATTAEEDVLAADPLVADPLLARSVRVVSVTHVQPEQTTGEMPPAAGDGGDHDDIVRLSFYDVMFVSTMPIQRLFFYEGVDLPPFPSLVSSLRSSLAAALAVFLPIAGKLTFRAARGDVVLDFSPAAVSPGVKFVEAEYYDTALDDMRRLAGDVEHHVEAFMELVPELEVERLPAPVLAVQVTRPACRNDDDAVGVVAVGVSMHHAVADGQSLWQFMKAWSAAAMVGSPAAPGLLPPTFDRALIRHRRADELTSKFLHLSSPTLPEAQFEVKLSRVAADVIKGQRTRTFLLRADQIRSLKRRISASLRIAAGEPPRDAPAITAYVAIASLVWTSVVRAKPHDAADEAYLMVTADCRRRLRPPIDPGYFGNCVAACYARANVGALRRRGDDDEGLARAAAAIGAAIREQLDDPLGDIEGWLQFHLSLPPARLTAVGSSHRFMAYETDFGWGAPSRVELVSPFARELVMLLGAADGGVQVSVSLDEAHMDAFETSWFQTAVAGKHTSISESETGREQLHNRLSTYVAISSPAIRMSSLVRVLRVSHVHPDEVAVGGAWPPPPRAVKLSFLDSFHVNRVAIQRLFFYEGDDLPPFHTTVLSLQSSLAAALAVFLPLAGKLAYLPESGDVVIDYSPDAVSPGVEFVEAEYSGSVDDMRRIAGDDEHQTEAFIQLVPDLDVSRLPAPLLAVQVTRASDDDGAGGSAVVAVGVAIHHGVADGQSVWQFIKAWAAAARGGSPEGPGLVPPTFDRSMIRHPEGDELAHRILHMKSPSLPVVTPRPTPDITQLRRRTFLLRAGEIRSLKQRISESKAMAGGEHQLHHPPSTYVAISSLVWTSIVRAKSLHAADDDYVYFMVSADCRRRLRPPADESYFGNCVGVCFARSSAGDLCCDDDEAGLARAAAAIQTAIREELEVEDPVANPDRWIERLAAIPRGRLTAAGSSHRYMAYETDFGWGAPRRVELVTVYGDEVVMMLGAADGGVQVSVVLRRALMDAFAANFRRQLLSESRSLVRVLGVSHVHPDEVAVAGAWPPPPRAVKLSFLDNLQLSKAAIQRLFFYDGGNLPPFESVVRSLQSSLAAVLAVFLPLAGKLAYLPDSGDVVIDYSPDAVSPGVKFVEAEYSGTVDDMRRLASDDEHQTEAFLELVPQLEVSMLPAPLLAVQVTRPRDDNVGGGGAVAVGVAIHHGVADGQSVWQFIKAWAAAARGGSPAGQGLVPPTFDRSMIRHPTADSHELAHMILHKMSPALPVVTPHSTPADMTQQRRRTFLLSAGEIQSLKQRISESKTGGEQLHNRLSTYVAISSLAWTSIVRAKCGALDAAADDVYFMVSADCRRRLRPPVDEGYFGNCIAIAIARASAGELFDDGAGLVHAATAIQTAIREELEDPMSDAGRWIERLAAIPRGRLTAAGSSHRYMAYETNFGWGAPRRVELVTVYGNELVAMLGGAADGGVQVSVVLRRALMDAFEDNFRRQVVACQTE